MLLYLKKYPLNIWGTQLFVSDSGTVHVRVTVSHALEYVNTL